MSAKQVEPVVNPRIIIGLAIGTVVLVAASIAMLSMGGNTSTTTTAPPVELQITGNGLPPLVAGQPDGAIGRLAPSFKGQTITGESLEVVPGSRPTVVLFLAHWCGHCQAEVSVVQSYVDEVGVPSSVDFYAVLGSEDPSGGNYPAEAWLEREGWTIPTIKDAADDRLIFAYGLTAYPYFVVIAPDGTVAGRATGGMDRVGIERMLQDMEAWVITTTSSAG